MASGNLDHIAPDLRSLAVPVDGLHLDPSNPRVHSEANLAAIRASLEAFGQQTPVVVRAATSVVEAGNGTLMAARQLGWKMIAAVLVEDEPLEAVGYGIADNRIADMAAYNLQLLVEQIAALESPPPGYTDAEVAALVQSIAAEPEPDDDSPYRITVRAFDPAMYDDLETELNQIADLSPEAVLKVKAR